MTQRIPLLLLLASGCIDFAGIELEACNERGLCGPDAGGDAGSMGMDASVARFCQPCTQSSQCGGGANLCVTISGGPLFCGVDCSNMLCGTGQSCQPFSRDGGFIGRNCIPTSGRCDGG